LALLASRRLTHLATIRPSREQRSNSAHFTNEFMTRVKVEFYP